MLGDYAYSQSPGLFGFGGRGGRGGPGGPGGPNREERKLVKVHDTNGNGWLDRSERAIALKTNESDQLGGFGGPGGRPGGQGGPGGDRRGGLWGFGWFGFGPPQDPPPGESPEIGRGPRGGGGLGGPGGGGPRFGSVDLDPLVGLDNDRMSLRSRLLAIPELRERYLQYVDQIVEDSLAWEKLTAEVLRILEFIYGQVLQTEFFGWVRAIKCCVPLCGLWPKGGNYRSESCSTGEPRLLHRR